MVRETTGLVVNISKTGLMNYGGSNKSANNILTEKKQGPKKFLAFERNNFLKESA